MIPDALTKEEYEKQKRSEYKGKDVVCYWRAARLHKTPGLSTAPAFTIVGARKD